MTKKTISPEFISLEEAAKMKEGTRITFCSRNSGNLCRSIKKYLLCKKNKSHKSFTSFYGY